MSADVLFPAPVQDCIREGPQLMCDLSLVTSTGERVV